MKIGYVHSLVTFSRPPLRAIILRAVSVAQLVEHRSVAPRVVGSNPIAHPMYPSVVGQPPLESGSNLRVPVWRAHGRTRGRFVF